MLGSSPARPPFGRYGGWRRPDRPTQSTMRFAMARTQGSTARPRRPTMACSGRGTDRGADRCGRDTHQLAFRLAGVAAVRFRGRLGLVDAVPVGSGRALRRRPGGFRRSRHQRHCGRDHGSRGSRGEVLADATDAALSWLDRVQEADGGWGQMAGYGTDPNSTALVLSSLIAVDQADSSRFAERAARLWQHCCCRSSSAAKPRRPTAVRSPSPAPTTLPTASPQRRRWVSQPASPSCSSPATSPRV